MFVFGHFILLFHGGVVSVLVVLFLKELKYLHFLRMCQVWLHLVGGYRSGWRMETVKPGMFNLRNGILQST